MSNVIRCEGPDCTQTAVPDSGARTAWLSASRGLARFDFHDAGCLAAWAAAQPTASSTVVDGR